MKKIYLTTFALTLLTCGLMAQCRTFVKNYCGAAMEGFVASENFNGARLKAGDVAELEMTFYGGQEYRLLICAHPVLGQVGFTVSDDQQKKLYSSAEHDFAPSFDFKPEGTRQLIVRIEVPADANAGILPQGCVGIITGKRDSGELKSDASIN